MGAYLIRRLLLLVPTLFAIMLVNFAVVQIVPGGPIERVLAQLDKTAVSATARMSGSGGETLGTQAPSGSAGASSSRYRGAQGLDPEFIQRLEKQFGLDQPLWKRFVLMMGNYLRFDFGNSYFRDKSVASLVIEKMPVSISLGIWTTLLTYLISIPLGIAKAVREGSRFDTATTLVVLIGFAIPGFVLGVFLIVLFAGGTFWEIFPLRGLTSDNWAELSWPARIADYFWHLTLPMICYVIGGFATVTLLTKNTFI